MSSALASGAEVLSNEKSPFADGCRPLRADSLGRRNMRARPNPGAKRGNDDC
jgi:hypothetical protein